MSEQSVESIEVGQVVEFVGYAFDDSNEDPVLVPGQRVLVERKAEPDDEGNVAYNVRPITESGEIDEDATGDQLFEDEFKIIEPDQIDSEEAIESVKEPTKKEKQKAKKLDETTPSEENEEDIHPATEPELEEEDEVEHDPIVAELLRGTNDTTELATNLYNEHEEIYYKLGGVLYELKKNKAHVAAGYENTSSGFMNFVQERVGPQERACYHYINIYKKFRNAGLDAAALRGIGWTKARLLTSLNEDDFAEYLEKAKTLSRDALETEIKALRENINKETIQKHKYTFVLFGEDNTIVQQALDHAAQQIDHEKDEKRRMSKAFEYICTQYALLEMDIVSE